MLNKDIAKLLANRLNNKRFVEYWLDHVKDKYYKKGLEEKLKTMEDKIKITKIFDLKEIGAKIKINLTVDHGYDFDSEFWTDDNITMFEDFILATKKAIKENQKTK